MELPGDVAAVAGAFERAIRPVVPLLGLYAGGSLASGDFVPGVSDLDLVAVTRERLDRDQLRQLRVVHRRFLRSGSLAAKLHCAYLPASAAADVSARHPCWAGGQLSDRPLSGVARAEVLRSGIIITGPPPAALIPPLDEASLRAAVIRELTGYWRTALGWRLIWLNDSCVDLGLLTLVRADALLAEGRLITKSEAIGRLGRFAVPSRLAQEIAARRAGTRVRMAPHYRIARARTARALVAAGIAALLQTWESPGPDSL